MEKESDETVDEEKPGPLLRDFLDALIEESFISVTGRYRQQFELSSF